MANSAAYNLVSTSTLGLQVAGNYVTNTYASTTFQPIGSYVTNNYASTTFPSFAYASSTYQAAGTYVTSVSGSGSITSTGGTTPTLSLQNLNANSILFGQGNNIIGTSTNFTFNSASNVLTVTNASTSALTVSGPLLVTGQSTLANASTSNLTVTALTYLATTTNSGTLSVTGSTTISSLVAGLVRTTASGALYTDTASYLTNTYASSTFPSFAYASSTFQPIGSYVTNSYASTTFPSFSYASSTYVGYGYASSTFQAAGTYVTSVTGSGSVLSSGGTTPTISLQNLTANDILFGQGNGTFATSTNFTFSTAAGLSVGVGNLNLATLTPSSLVMTDAGRNLQSVALGTGLSFTGNTLNVASAGNYFTQNGNALYNNVAYEIGVNSTTPTANLVVEGSSTNPTLPIFTVASSSNASFLTVLANGNVGIGTTGPSQKLEISNANNTSTGATLRLTDTNVGGTYFDIGTSGGQAGLSIQQGGTQVMRIRSNGNVNFGTGVTPANRFEVQKNGSTDYFGITNVTSGDVMEILNNGNVGIGTTSPS